jgi:hypothetical protein
VQAAWGAARKKNSYFQAQFLRLKARNGAKKAAIAVAASILTTVYHMLRDGTYYQDLGPGYFTRRNPAQAAAKLANRIRNPYLSVSCTVDLIPSHPAPRSTRSLQGKCSKCTSRTFTCATSSTAIQSSRQP